MSYAAVQTAVLALVRAYSSGAVFTTATSSEDDWRVLDNDRADVAAVVTQAGDSTEGYEMNGRASSGHRYAQHEVGVMVASAIRTENDAAAIATLYSTVEGLKTHLRKYPRLNNAVGVKHAEISRTTRRRMIAPAIDETRSTHWSQMIVLSVIEEIDLAWVEQAY